MFGLGSIEDTYQNLLKCFDDQDYNIYLESLCNSDTKWIEAGGENIVRRMDLCLESKVWYQYVKLFLRPTAHNETVNKSRLVLLHCINSSSEVNVVKDNCAGDSSLFQKEEGYDVLPMFDYNPLQKAWCASEIY